jgi:DNA polymerase I
VKLLSADVIRRCLIADPGKVILSADFDQIELRIAAGLAQENVLIDAAKRGESLHKTTAIKIFGEDYTPDQYRYTKNLNFGWLFGGGAKTLSEQTGVPVPECVKLIQEYESALPSLAAYKRREQDAILRSALTASEYKLYRSLRSRSYHFRYDTREGKAAKASINIQLSRLLYRKIGYAITPYGRRLIVDAEKAYTVVNYKVQSAARDIMAQALLDVMDDPELEPTVLLPVHDEILGQAVRRKAEHVAQRYGEVMSREFMGVPVTASGKVYGKSWGHGYRKDSHSA